MRRTISETHYDKENMTTILKQILKPKKTCAISAPNEIFKTIEETMIEYFYQPNNTRLLDARTS